MDNGSGNTAKSAPVKPAPARPKPLAVIPDCVLNGTMTPAQAAQAELKRQRENPSAAPIIPLEVQDQQHVTAWVVAAPIEMARIRARAEAEQAMRDGTFNEKFAASQAARAARAAGTAPPLPTQSASWGVWNALASVGLVRPAPSIPTDNPHSTTVSTSPPPTMPDIQDPDNDDASSSVTANNNHLLASVIDLGLEIPAEQADGFAASVLPDTLRDLQIPEAIDRPVNNMPAINVQDHEAVVVSPPLPPTPFDMPAEEIALEEAEEHEAPPLEADAVEEQTAMDEAIAERERLAEIQRQAEEVARLEALATAERERQEEIQRQLDETARIERARAEAILVQQQALLLQQQHEREREEASIREAAAEAARVQQAALDAAAAAIAENQRSLAAARAAGF